MFRRLTLAVALAFATSGIASAQVFFGGHYSSHFNYSAPSYGYAAAPIVYHRVPIYVIRKKPTVRVVHHYITSPAPVAAPQSCGCDASVPATGH